MPMTSNELIASLREMKKTNPAEYAVFQKDYAEEMTEGVSFWGVNDGYLTLWKLSKEVEDEFDAGDFGNKNCLGDEWGGFSGVSTRIITKKMMEYGDFCEREDESDDEEDDKDCGCGYNHYHKDKCPTGAECEKYEKWETVRLRYKKPSEDEEIGCSSCPKCETTYTQKQIDDGEVVPCNRCYKCFVGECGKDNCDCEPEKEGCDCGCGCGAPCSVDDPKTVRQENEKDKEETKKAMKDYVKARLNHLMGLGQKQMNEDGGDGEVECLFTRREEWDGEVFDNIICSLCDKRDGELNASKSGYEFSVGAEMTEKDDKVWEVSVSWSTLYDQNPFDDFYDEDEDNGSDSDDE